MILLNTKEAMAGTRIDLAVIKIFKYEEICVQTVREIPDYLALAEPTLATTMPVVLYCHDRDKVYNTPAQILHTVAYYHPYATHPLLITFDQFLVITDITSEDAGFEEVVEEFKVIDTLSSAITLDLIATKLFEHFPTEVDLSKVDVKAVTRRHTFAMEVLTLN